MTRLCLIKAVRGITVPARAAGGTIVPARAIDTWYQQEQLMVQEVVLCDTTHCPMICSTIIINIYHIYIYNIIFHTLLCYPDES